MTITVSFEQAACKVAMLFMFSAENNSDFTADLKRSLEKNSDTQQYYRMPNFDAASATNTHTQDMIDAAEKASTVLIGHNALSFAVLLEDGSAIELTPEILNSIA